MIDLLGFFGSISDLTYCVVKVSPTFPRYTPNEDVDIFCYSVDDTIKRLLTWGDRYVGEGFEIKVRTLGGKGHVHVDFMKESRLEFRFDLYGELPSYTKVVIKPALFESVIENSRPVEYPRESGQVAVMMPSALDDMLIRYLEFVEWYDVRPDKLKHLEYILDKADEEVRKRFLDKLHHYTSLPPASPLEPGLMQCLKNSVQKVVAALRSR